MDTIIPENDSDSDTTSFPDDGLNHRQRKFAEHYLDGHFAKQAAILAGYSQDNAARIATRLLRTPAIAAYLTAERDRLCAESFYSRRLLVDWLWKVIHTSADDVRQGDNIIQELTIRETADGTRTRRVKMVNKLAALRQLARMHGFDKPELCLPGNLAGAFQAFQVVNHLGQAPPPGSDSSPHPLHDRDHSPRPLTGRDRSPSGPAEAAHPTLPGQGPDPRPSSGRDRSPSGPVEAAHPTLPAQGPDPRLHSSHPIIPNQGPAHTLPTNPPEPAPTLSTPHPPDDTSPPAPPLSPSPLASMETPPTPTIHTHSSQNLPPDHPPYQAISRRKSPTVLSPIPL